MNYSTKILINLIFGLSNSEYSALYDTKFTLFTTINGILIICMLADKIYTRIPTATILSKNTDGIEILVERKDVELLNSIFEEITNICKIPYETNVYRKYVIRDINNYLAITESGDIKTKGVSASIIPQALQEYFKNGTPIEDTINNHNNIYDFCYGVKGSGSYSWLLTTYNPDLKVAKSELMNHRFLRYYAGGNQTISKFWTKGKKQDGIDAIEANTPVTLALNIPKEEIFDYKKGVKVEKMKERYPNLNKDWYISQAYKIVNKIENQEII